MKRYKLYLLSLLLSLPFFSNCSDNDESYTNKVFVNARDKVGNLLIKANVVNEEREIQTALAKPESRDIVVTYKVEASLLSTYNQAYYDDAIILPAEYYSFSETEVIIKAGSIRAPNLTVYFKEINKLDGDLVYVLPVTIASANIGILESARTTYYVLKGAALINVVADIEDNYLHIDTWVNPGPVNNLTQLTLEALIRSRDYERLISTVMGIEGKFLIRLGDAGFPKGQIQIANPGGNFPDGDSNKVLPLNEWIHIAVTYDSSNGDIIIYVNGKVQSSGTRHAGVVNFGVDGEDGFYIGRSWEDSRFLAGEVSECRIWSLVRTEEQIANNPYEVNPTEEGLVAYWKCDDGGGMTVKDHTSNGNDLTAKSPITWTPVSLPPSNK